MDSGAGQSVFGSEEAFITSSLRPCNIIIEGVSGNVGVRSVGTVRLLVETDDGQDLIVLLHNTLNSRGLHNLVSVSHLQASGFHTAFLGNRDPALLLGGTQGKTDRIPLLLDEGMFQLPCGILSSNDPRLQTVPSTPLSSPGEFHPATTEHWTRKVLMAPVTTMPSSFGESLTQLCASYIAPAGLPPSRRKFSEGIPSDMADLAIRFMGPGHDRLSHTIHASLGLSDVSGKVPPNLFPQGKLKRSKVPIVSKSIVHDVEQAAAAEVVFTDTFMTGDEALKYGQAFVDYRSGYGWVYPIESRRLVGLSFATFCANHFTPAILVRDNIGENIGGDLIAECLHRSVKSAFICPHTPCQDYAEGFLGRVTSMASFAMVYSGAKLFMWRWAIISAAFINNITARWFSQEKIWAQPYQLIHGEAFPDSSIVMPWGCGALVMLTPDELSKFKSRCALMIFVHYAIQHPLYTYAMYSPRTKRIVYRQDYIFLTDVFPMRDARFAAKLPIDGDLLSASRWTRSPTSISSLAPSAESFGTWDGATLPDFDNHLDQPIEDPGDSPVPIPIARSSDWPTQRPDHPLFGESMIDVPFPPLLRPIDNTTPIPTSSSINPSSTSVSSVTTPAGNDNEMSLDAQAAGLVGSQFYDEELLWCTVTAWGTSHGTHIIYYRPTVPTSTSSGEDDFSSLTEVMAWIGRSPEPPDPSPPPESRQIRRSPRFSTALVARFHPARPAPSPLLFGQPFSRLPVTSSPTRRSAFFLKPARLRQVLKAKETIFKYGVRVPRGDRDAATCPDAIRWKAGRDLEWMRLQAMNTFDGNWTWSRVKKEFPTFTKGEIGHLFYVYDYKFSGERRVRCVYDGREQSPLTYNETYAPTVRPESIRFFHLYCVEHGLEIMQWDVPCAFLQSEADCDIFVYPPEGNADRPGQILRLRKMLYGAKQSAYLWNKKLDLFLKGLGFTTSLLDPCFYKRREPGADIFTTIILHCDDLRVGGTRDVVKIIHDSLYKEYKITSADGTRFLGMDVAYDLREGILKFSMKTYIANIVERFTDADPELFREIVGCLLWCVLCVRGPELMRVKDLAQRSNNFGPSDFQDALKVLHRLNREPDLGIVFRRGGAGKELIPATTRPKTRGDQEEDAYHLGSSDIINELGEKDLYVADNEDGVDAEQNTELKEFSSHFTLTAYTDASFAVGPKKQSVSGWIVMVNGVPMVWGSLRQTFIVDSSCSAEYVGASICMKQVKAVEAMMEFLEVRCQQPYPVYTDSQACKFIGDNSTKLGRVRHLDIRTHMVRCYISLGEVELIWCTTESCLGDIMTKIVSSAQDDRLALRFYNDCVFPNEA